MSAEAEGTEGPKASSKKISKKLKKPLDKSENLWYNTDTKGKEKEIKTMYNIQFITKDNQYGIYIPSPRTKKEADQICKELKKISSEVWYEKTKRRD